MSQVKEASETALGRFLHELSEGVRRQGNVIFALVFKDFKTKSRRDSIVELLWVLAEPGVNTMVLAAFWYVVRRQQIGGVNVALFLLVSFGIYTLVQHGISGPAKIIKANRGYYNFQQVKPIDAIIARYLLDWLLLFTGSLIALFLLGWFGGLYVRHDRLLEFTGMLAMATTMGFGLSLAIGTYAAIYDIIGKVFSMFTKILLFVSLVIFDGNDLPTAARYFISWNPIAQIEEYGRYYLLGVKLFPEANLAYAQLWTIITLFFGLLAYYANRQRLYAQ
ncbi:MAG: ABC transporter permease [Rhizobiales bacterium]|nr:ABC transporter permease [Hyphomicrobiales bacterium]